MAVGWNASQRREVETSLARHPHTSGRCAQAAREILPVAKALDPQAHALLVEPGLAFARYVLPRHRPRPEWHHHVLVEVLAHGVDALTGPDGHPLVDYLATYFDAPQAHRVRAVDLGRDDL